MVGDLWLERKRYLGLRTAFLVGCGFGFVSVVPDLLFHALSVALSGCPKTLTSFISCGGRGPHLEFLAALGMLCVVAFPLLVGRLAYLLKKGGENG